MASNYWIKLYDEILDDPKMGRLSDGAYRLCINLFLLASRQEARDGELPEFSDIAWNLRLSDETLCAYWSELEKANIVHVDVAGKNRVTHFKTRQAAVSKAEKQKQYRDRERGKALRVSDQPVTNGVTFGNADIDIDVDKDIYTHYAYQSPPPEHISTLISAINKATKTRLWEKTELEFESVAYMVAGYDCTEDDVAAFGKWWAVPGNGYYAGLPALKSFGDEFPNFLAKRKTESNGHTPLPDDGLAELMAKLEFTHAD